MDIQTESYTYPLVESVEHPRKFWKDASLLGCVISGILLGLVAFKLLSPATGIPQVRKVKAIKQQLAAEIEQLRAENARLAEEIEGLRTDLFYQEKIAREELNMALPDEIIYKFAE